MSKLKVFFLIIFGLIITFFVFNNLLRMMYPIKYYSYIEKYSAMYDLDKYLVMSVIKVESNFNEKATSVKDARGLMQIPPSTGN